MPLSSARVFDYSDDAAVAKLLADEAKAASSKYASQGLSALLPKRSTGAAPKPNTRFLKNLVRDADQHNTALRRKEDRERVERLRNGGVKRNESLPKDESNGRTRPGGYSGRDAKRRRTDDYGHTRRGDRDAGRLDRDFSSSPKRRRDPRSVSRSRSRTPPGEKERNRSRRHGSDKHSADERQSHGHEDKHTSHRKHKRRRSRSGSRSRSPDRDDRRRRHPTSIRDNRDGADRESSSDPLDDLVGPQPPDTHHKTVHYRGRGAHKLTTNSTTIDDHFSTKYDPASDVRLDPDVEETDDWDLALDALRDRRAWEKNHADRMRAAGFSAEEIRKWEDSGKEKDARDVRWSKRGQTRAWDVGKDVLSLDGAADNDVDDFQEDNTGRLTP
ncbi:uncharacterized protein AB675_11687 [Cyphellophora attinorum]|uniref:Pre-mRNA-splicing factor 38B n=1 Tax=Cyphellophora attinorum TaxID=1664694 RepID=A0A0N1HHQ8_9EURO|nr:uncharacterized protein AB675_11687 [Phialophora attinorum]KPI35400.1 hypothetical protein AB675_11687 [Phialophora attinorum]